MAAFEHTDPNGACKQGEGSPCPACEFTERLWDMIAHYSYEITHSHEFDEPAHADVVRSNEVWSKAESDLCQLLSNAARAIAEHRGNRNVSNEACIARQLVRIYARLDDLRAALEIDHPEQAAD